MTPKPAFTAHSRPAGAAPFVRPPANGLQTPFEPAADDPSAFRAPIAIYASTPTPIPSYASQRFDATQRQHTVPAGAVDHPFGQRIDSSTAAPIANYGAQRFESSTARAADDNAVRPIFDRSSLRHRAGAALPPLVASNQLGSGYDPQYPQYDGVAQTANGFQYYLRRHYHEEESDASGQRRDGSFGYVDPFGIRRVVYYRATPEGGFEHRKNNRYVGQGATPYDPRPL